MFTKYAEINEGVLVLESFSKIVSDSVLLSIEGPTQRNILKGSVMMTITCHKEQSIVEN